MNILQEALTALLSGLTKKTGNEIHWRDNTDQPITIEPINAAKNTYIIRYYWGNGNKRREVECKNGEQHGNTTSYFKNEDKFYRIRYTNGKENGNYIGWYENGQKQWETKYKNNKLHGRHISWDENGNKIHEIEYKNGKYIRKIKNES